MCSTACLLLAGAPVKARTTAPAAHAARALDHTETLKGTVAMIEGHKNIAVLTGANGVPYDFVVTPATRVAVDGQKASLKTLAPDTKATVRFIPRASGNVALRIDARKSGVSNS